jgi:AcrR family transcriptional regulator
MARRTGADTKREILQAAAMLFHTQGYRGTSLTDIAQMIGYSKASVLYHFPTKEALLIALVAPAIADFEALLDRLAPLPIARARRAMAEGLADLALRHGDVAAVLNTIGPHLTSDPSLEFFNHEDLFRRCVRLVAGDDAGPQAEVAVDMALAGGIAACLEHRHLPPDQLRAALVAVLSRVLDLPPST